MIIPIDISLIILIGIIGVTIFILKKLNLLSPPKKPNKIYLLEEESVLKISVDDIRIVE